MARLPSFDSQIDKAKADAGNAQELSSGLAQSIAALPNVASATTFESETSQMVELRALKVSLEADLLMFVTSFGMRTDAAYGAFETVDDVSPYERFVAFFTRRAAGSFKAVRLKQLAIAESLKIILLETAEVHGLLQTRKDTAIALLSAAEPKLVTSMELRRSVVSSMEDARQRDKGLAATLATLQRKITDATDETRLNQWKAEETEATAKREAVLSERKNLSRQHDILDRQAVLFGDFIDLLNDDIFMQALLLNKLNVEAERCIQLYDAVFGSLEPLLTEAQPQSSLAIEDASPLPLAAFRELLTLHSQGAVTMQDIEKRKKRADEALLRRRDTATQSGV